MTEHGISVQIDSYLKTFYPTNSRFFMRPENDPEHFRLPKERDYTEVGRVRVTMERLEA